MTSSSVEVMVDIVTELIAWNPSWVPPTFHVVLTVLQPRDPYVAQDTEVLGRA